MAYNVFGNPITDATLEKMPEYHGQTITRKDRADVAFRMKNAEEKDVNARNYVENLKKQWGDGVSTLCLFYNATGDPISLITSHDWWGHIGQAPYPQEIANGQWGAFLHVKRSGTADGSEAAVVYHGRNDAGTEYDFMQAWSNPWNRWAYDNKAYSEVRDAGHFDGTVWGVIEDKMSNSGYSHRDTYYGCVSIVSTGSDTSPIYEAILTLDGVHLL